MSVSTPFLHVITAINHEVGNLRAKCSRNHSNSKLQAKIFTLMYMCMCVC